MAKSEGPKRPRKARSNDRRNSLKLIRDAARESISKLAPGNKFIGVLFSFSTTGQGTIFCYHVDPGKPSTVQITNLTDPSLLRAAITANL